MSPLAIDRPDISAYIEGLFASEDEVLRSLRQEIARRNLPEIQVSAEVGRLLQLLLLTIGARRVVEVGTLGGYSALWLARALPPEGRLITLELEKERAELARDFAARAGLAEVVDVRVGDARDLLPGIAAEGPFDAFFIDADKEGYPEYLGHALGMVRPGGLILADNTLWGGAVLDPSSEPEGPAEALRRFNWSVASAAELESTLIPVRDGLTVALVRPRSSTD